MGLFDAVIGNAVLNIKADTTQAQIAMRALAGEEKKAAQASIQAMEDRSKAAELGAARIVKAGALVGGAIAIGVASFEKYEESSRLSAATAGVSMDRLRAASHGLVTDLGLMQIAATGMGGRMKLTADEMESVLGAAVALERKGVMPLSEATQKLTEAIKSGEVSQLKVLGITYDETLAKTDKRAAAMKALTELSKESAGATDSEADAIRQSGVAFKNSINEIESSIGRLVVAMGPLISATAKLVGLVASVISAVLPGGDESGNFAKDGSWLDEQMMFRDPTTGSLVNFNSLFAGTSRTASMSLAADKAKAAREQAKIDAFNKAHDGSGASTASSALSKYYQGLFKKRGGGGGGYDVGAATTDGEMRNFQLGPGEGIDRAIEAWLADRLNFPADDTSASDGLVSGFAPMSGNRTDLGLGQFSTEKAPTILERMFGAKGDLDAYRVGFSALSDTVLAAYDAMVSGSESVGKAIKNAIAGTIGGLGRKMQIRAIEETAEGFAALFTPGLQGTAVGHFKSAALFEAGAIAAGLAARELGGGGGAGRGAGASASGVGLGGGGSPQPVNRTVIIGSEFGFESPRDQQRQFASRMRRVRQFDQETEGTRYS